MVLRRARLARQHATAEFANELPPSTRDLGQQALEEDAPFRHCLGEAGAVSD